MENIKLTPTERLIKYLIVLNNKETNNMEIENLINSTLFPNAMDRHRMKKLIKKISNTEDIFVKKSIK